MKKKRKIKERYGKNREKITTKLVLKERNMYWIYIIFFFFGISNISSGNIHFKL